MECEELSPLIWVNSEKGKEFISRMRYGFGVLIITIQTKQEVAKFY